MFVCDKGPRLLLNRYGFPSQCSFSLGPGKGLELFWERVLPAFQEKSPLKNYPFKKKILSFFLKLQLKVVEGRLNIPSKASRGEAASTI